MPFSFCRPRKGSLVASSPSRRYSAEHLQGWPRSPRSLVRGAMRSVFMPRILVRITAILILVTAGVAPAMAAEITLLSPGAMMSSLKVLVPQFETATGHRVAVKYSPALAIADRAKTENAEADVI